MKNSLYFAVLEERPQLGPLLRMGCGFDERGDFVCPTELPEGCEGLVMNDLYPPSEAGAQEARDYVNQNRPLLVCDFEQPVQPQLLALLSALPEELLVVPEQYADQATHAAVLTEAYLPKQPFARWLAGKRSRFGALLLDMRPIACAVRCTGTGELFAAEPPPGRSFECEGLQCRYTARLEQGVPVYYFHDTAATLLKRCAEADQPGIVLLQEFKALQRSRRTGEADAPSESAPV